MVKKSNTSLKKYAIVFDLDETLIHSIDISEWNKNPLRKTIEKKYPSLIFPIDEDTIGIKRPYMDELLKFVSDNFGHVGVWSAGIKPYVESICTEIFTNKKLPHTVWSRFDCDYKIVLPDKETTFVKPLNQIWDMCEGFTEENTFMIEDRKDTVLYNPHNLVRVTPFKPFKYPDMLRDDTDLLVLLDFFKSVKKESNFIPVPLLTKPYLKN